MPNTAAQAYARVATTTATPRDIEAQALLKAANKLQDAVTHGDPISERTTEALMFNRKLWSIFVKEALNDENPQPVDVRQNIANYRRLRVVTNGCTSSQPATCAVQVADRYQSEHCRRLERARLIDPGGSLFSLGGCFGRHHERSSEQLPHGTHAVAYAVCSCRSGAL